MTLDLKIKPKKFPTYTLPINKSLLDKNIIYIEDLL